MTTTHSQTFDVVQSLLAKQFGLASSAIGTDTKLADLGLDSLSCIDFALNLESALKCSIDDTVVLQWKTVADVVETIDAVRS